MKQRIITGVLFTIFMFAILISSFWYPWLSVLLFLGVAIIGSHEMLQALNNIEIKPEPSIFYASILVITGPLLLTGVKLQTVSYPDFLTMSTKALLIVVLSLGFFCFLQVLTMLFKVGPAGLKDGIFGAAGMLYLMLPLGLAICLLYTVPHGLSWLILSLLTPWVSDVFAYFIGSKWGKYHFIPKISPNKTVAGFLGGILGSILFVGLYLFCYFKNQNLAGLSFAKSIVFVVGAGCLLSVFSQFGDWMASAIKRCCGIKDFSNLLPGHGGIIDRFDSVFFSLFIGYPLGVIYMLFI